MKNDNKWFEIIKKNAQGIGSILMIAMLFIGNLYTYGAKFGSFAEKYGISGYNLIFNGETFYAVMLLVVPLALLVVPRIDGLKKQQKVVELVGPLLALAVLLVMRLNLKDIMNGGNGTTYAVSFSSGFGFSGIIYLLVTLLLLVVGVINYFSLNVTEKTLKEAYQNKNLGLLKSLDKGENSNES